MRSALVTGANGFLGRALCRKLQARGVHVRALLRTECSGPWQESVSADLTDTAIPAGIMEGIDTVFHLAGKAHALSERLGDAADEYQAVNVEGTSSLLKHAEQAAVHRFLYYSSIKAQGGGAHCQVDETDTTPPDTPYGVSKLRAEVLVRAATAIPHRVILRPTMVYGPGSKGNLPRMIRFIQRGLFPPWPQIRNRRSMVHVDDLIEATLLAATHPDARAETYIVADHDAYSTRELYVWIREALGKPIPSWSLPLPILNLAATIGDGFGAVLGRRFPFDSDTLNKLVADALYDGSKMRTQLGFTPKHTLRAALPEIIQSM
ncbi:MAG: NAD-dependent epimerase/dehydratase family protein [Magnetococcales bacterium]|nr:NAD-dependent epimerase/dehydratase family protein [Magnetococcales bacterium]